ncbi:MAG: DoxX family membrane protein [Cyanobacteria bacterium P01_A01_bin.84]
MKKKYFLWFLRLVAAVIMLQTLFLKFLGFPESAYIFETIGMEPWGRYLSGVLELIASILILAPKKPIYGALLGLFIISGAIFFHLTKLGIEIMDDGGLLFFLALTVFVCCLILVLDSKEQILKFKFRP